MAGIYISCGSFFGRAEERLLDNKFWILQLPSSTFTFVFAVSFCNVKARGLLDRRFGLLVFQLHALYLIFDSRELKRGAPCLRTLWFGNTCWIE